MGATSNIPTTFWAKFSKSKELELNVLKTKRKISMKRGISAQKATKAI
jgi:hypothetical protein